MFFNSNKEINKLTKDRNRLISKGIFLIQIKIGIRLNRLRKEMNKLLNKGMSNIYLKVTIETFSKLRFSGFSR